VAKPRVPREFYDERHHVYGVFVRVAEEQEDPKELAEELTRLLPKGIREAAVWRDRLTGLWRYEYGEPYDDLPGDEVIIGTDQWPDIRRLYLGVRAANYQVGEPQLLGWLERLAVPAKHLDVLSEMRPIIKLREGTSARFEVVGHGMGNKTIDWFVEPTRGRPVLMDVKNRRRSLIDHMTQILPGIQAGQEMIVPDAPDPSDLFRDTVEKFLQVDRSVCLQGVWVHPSIKEDRRKLRDYFAGLDEFRVHFTILADWADDATILVRDCADAEYLMAVFSLEASDRFVTSEYRDSNTDAPQ